MARPPSAIAASAARGDRRVEELVDFLRRRALELFALSALTSDAVDVVAVDAAERHGRCPATSSSLPPANCQASISDEEFTINTAVYVSPSAHVSQDYDAGS